MTEMELFKLGVKPAYLLQYRGFKGQENSRVKLLKEDYPYIIFEHRNCILFFQDELSKEWFEVNGCICYYSEKLGRWIQDFKHNVLGLALGYPPIAVNDHERVLEGKLKDKVRISYYGLAFICDPKHIDGCISWLERYRPVPKEVKSRGYVGCLKTLNK